MLYSVKTAELLNACRVLFAIEDRVDVNFVKALELSELKGAYRKKALETHPDRAKMLGKSETELRDGFQEVLSAYETLTRYVTGKKRAEKTGSVRRRKRGKQCRDHYYHGPMPSRELKIGQFLYYSGLISWRVLIDAIVSQKKKRPLFGEHFITHGVLTAEDIDGLVRRAASHNQRIKLRHYS